MMTRAHRRNHQRNDDFNGRKSNHWLNTTAHEPRAETHRLGAYSVTGRGGHNTANRARFRGDPNNSPNHTQLRPGTNNRQNDHNPFADPRSPYGSSKRFHDNQKSSNYAQNHFHIGSQRFKEYLLNSINHTLRQIQQWHPDHDEETAENDRMDWQPECEFIIPPAQKIHYIWDKVPLSKAPIVGEVDFMERSTNKEIHATIPSRRRVSSEGYIGLRKGVLVPDVCDVPRRDGIVSPRSVGPVGPDMEVEF